MILCNAEAWIKNGVFYAYYYTTFNSNEKELNSDPNKNRPKIYFFRFRSLSVKCTISHWSRALYSRRPLGCQGFRISGCQLPLPLHSNRCQRTQPLRWSPMLVAMQGMQQHFRPPLSIYVSISAKLDWIVNENISGRTSGKKTWNTTQKNSNQLASSDSVKKKKKKPNN